MNPLKLKADKPVPPAALPPDLHWAWREVMADARRRGFALTQHEQCEATAVLAMERREKAYARNPGLFK